MDCNEKSPSVEAPRAETGAQAAPKRRGGLSRRALLAGCGGAAVLMGLGTLKFVPEASLVRPPGGQDEALLEAGCLRCEKCYEACPRQVISLAHVEDGILNARTPVLNFDTSFCDYCTADNGGAPRCVEVCPTGCLALPPDATPETVILGKAVLNKDWCLAYNLIGCRFCFDACPYEAIELDGHGRPAVLSDRCNGCGACESVCVSLKEGSIAPGATARAIVVVPEGQEERA